MRSDPLLHPLLKRIAFLDGDDEQLVEGGGLQKNANIVPKTPTECTKNEFEFATCFGMPNMGAIVCTVLSDTQCGI